MINRIRHIKTALFLLIFLIPISLFAGDNKAKEQSGTTGEETSFQKVFKLDQKWIGDFDQMVKRRTIRALVTFSQTYYFLDKADQRGVTYEFLKKFEQAINKKLKRRHLRVHVLIIPVPRNQLISGLVEGRGDIAAAGLLSIPEYEDRVDFADPFITGVNEIVVGGPNASKLSSTEDISGKTIHVRKSSSYYRSLSRLNQSFKKIGKPEVIIEEASEFFEDEDLLEMVNAGLIPMTVVNSHLADFWSQIFKEITPYPNIHVNTGREIAWVIRKNSPKLKKEIDSFVKAHKKGTLFGNIMFKRYLQNTKWVRNSLSNEDIIRFKTTVDLFREYAGRYGFDWLMVAALAYQESRIDQSKRSPAGAIGVMQMLPSTASSPEVNIPNIKKKEKNIHAGVKYLRWIYDTYFKDEDMDELNKRLFTFASYNAGPNRITGLRQLAEKMGFDPNIWFRHVEVAAAKKIGRETVQYVSNIYKYYIAYRLIVDKLELKKEVKRKIN